MKWAIFTTKLVTCLGGFLLASSALGDTKRANPKNKLSHQTTTKVLPHGITEYEKAILNDNNGILPDTRAHDDLVKSDPNYVPAMGAYSPTLGPSGLFNGIFVGNSTYDHQHNRGSGTMIDVTSRTAFGKRYVHVTWMCLKTQDILDNNRQVNYNCYDWNTAGWTLGTDDHGGICTTSLEDRDGYTFMSVTDDGLAMVFKHSAPEGAGNKTNICWFVIPGLGIFNNWPLPNRVGAENIWPNGDVSRKGGQYYPMTDVIHVFADDSNQNPGIATHAYWRCAEDGSGFGWRGPYAMDSTNANSHGCFADGDRVIYALAKPIIYSEDDRTHCDLGYYESLNAGLDWENAGGLVVSWDAGGAFNTTAFQANEDRTVYNDFHGGFDSEGRLHFAVPMLYRDTDDGTAYVLTEMMHWDEGTPGSNENANTSLPYGEIEVNPSKEGFRDGTEEHWSVVSRAMWPSLDGAVGAFSSYQCNTSMAFGDGSTICQGFSGDESNLDYVYIVYTQFGANNELDLADASANGMHNANVWMSISNDNGFSWAAGKCITTENGTVGGTPTRSPDCDVTTGDTCLSEHWSSCAPLVDDHVHVFYVGDLDAGAIPFGEGSWSLNDLMYYPIPCEDYGDCCPAIAPVLAATITVDPDCEYYGDGENPVNYESLTVENLGNATLTYSIDFSYLPGSGSGWLTFDGGIGEWYDIPPGGDPDLWSIEMDGSALANGLWQAEIRISHNDPSQSSPFIFPINFFRADSFICGNGVVVTTPRVALEVSNTESFGRENDRGGMWYYNELDEDSLFNPIFDGSLLIANKTKSAGETKYVYRDIFINQTPSNPGFRALEDLRLSYDPVKNDSVVEANQCTIDSLIGVSVQYLFPQEAGPNESEFVRIKFKVYPRPGGVGQNLVIGAAADIDCPGRDADGLGSENIGGYVENYNLVYQQGLDTTRTTEFIRETNKYVAGLTAITCEPILGGWIYNNPDHVYPENGFDDDTVYMVMTEKAGYNIWADSAEDIHTILAIDEITLAEDETHVYQVGVVSSIAGMEDVSFDDYEYPYEGYVTDLIATTAQAWKKGFGWCSPWWWRYGNTVLIEGSGEIFVRANGTHEGGLDGGCCGCVFSYAIDPLPDEGVIFFDALGGCEARVIFAGIRHYGTYNIKLIVEDLCSSQADTVMTMIEVIETIDDCGYWGDVTGDDKINPVDVVYMVNYVYLGIDMIIPLPYCVRAAGDVNCDNARNPVDVVLYVNRVYLDNDMFCPDPLIGL